MFSKINLQLAFKNLFKNKELFLPFIISTIVTVIMMVVVISLPSNEGISQIPGGHNLQTILTMGSFIMIAFSLMFLMYINSFITSNRQKEFGLYHVLGMNKRNISIVLLAEMLYMYLISLGIGLLGGVIFNKITILAIRIIMNAEISFGSEISLSALIITSLIFLIFFIIISLIQITKLYHLKTIELIQSDKKGEKEPSSNLLLVIVGAAIIVEGIYLALSIQSPIGEIFKAFLATILVIVGIYFLFTSITTIVLKLLKSKKDFYYQVENYIPISSLLYRMKKNGIGLANITIMSIATILIFSVELSLILAPSDSLDTQFPSDVLIEAVLPENGEEANNKENMINIIDKTANDLGIEFQDLNQLTYLQFPGIVDGNTIYNDGKLYEEANVSPIYMTDQKNYNYFTQSNIKLNQDEIIISASSKQIKDGSVQLFETKYNATINNDIKTFPLEEDNSPGSENVVHIIVPSFEDLYKAEQQQASTLGDFASEITILTKMNLEVNDENEILFTDSLKENIEMGGYHANVGSKANSTQNLIALQSGVSFVVINLGLLLMVATFLTVYFKNISEALYEKNRFSILKKIGLSQREIKKSLSKQNLLMFVSPLIIAGILILLVYPLAEKYMFLLVIDAVNIFKLNIMVAFTIFTVFYLCVYRISSKNYYKIINS
ncbi:FtsX-like permease family protein [Facklamia sp. DSM 111018]|uniref:FtsX-like permease family protein n=1 Tax=Facklamia lactis TaxID=2749967 RepID=A0ABS0LQ92_9LACT|nr:FtsX-like permease family protein [Facklamia lactis]MBG9986336.1 FtsX-like permease family protein [Facklamia lactis]